MASLSESDNSFRNLFRDDDVVTVMNASIQDTETTRKSRVGDNVGARAQHDASYHSIQSIDYSAQPRDRPYLDRRRDIDRDEILRIHEWRDSTLPRASPTLQNNIDTLDGLVRRLQTRHQEEITRQRGHFDDTINLMNLRFNRDVESLRQDVLSHQIALKNADAQKHEACNNFKSAQREVQELRFELQRLSEEMAESRIVSGNLGKQPIVAAPKTEKLLNIQPIPQAPIQLQQSYSWGDSLDFFPSVPTYDPAKELRVSEKRPVISEKLLERSMERDPEVEVAHTSSHSTLPPKEQPKRRSTCGDVIRPDNFNPNKENWRDYAYKFECIADWNGWNEKEAARYVVTRISGEPLNYIKRQSVEVRNDWEKLRKALEDYYAQPAISLKYQAEFDTVQRKQNETWSEFAQRLRTIAEKAYGRKKGDSEPLFEALLLAKFLKLLPDKIHHDVALKELETVEEAALASMKVEAIDRKKPSKPDESPKKATGGDTDAHSALEEIFRRARETVGVVTTPTLTSGDTFSNNAGRGRGRGTNSGNGYRPGRGRGRGQGRGYSGDRPAPILRYGSTVCYRCGGRGHISSSCPSIVVKEDDQKADAESAQTPSSVPETSSAEVTLPPN